MRVGTRQEHHGSLVKLLSEIVRTPEEFDTLDRIAAWSGFSPDHVNRLFRGFIGEPAMQLVRRIQLERAAQQLSLGVSSVSETGFEAGYSEPEAFTKAFRKAYGVPPSAFAGDWRVAAASGVHWGEDATCTPLLAGAETYGVRLLVRDGLSLWGRTFIGDFRLVPQAWADLLPTLDPSLVKRATWVTMFHSDGLKTKDRDHMRSRLAFVAEVGLSPPQRFERVEIPAGPFVTTKEIDGPQEHWDAWVFLNRHWVPKPENRLELPGFDVYRAYPAPWSALRAQIWLGLE